MGQAGVQGGRQGWRAPGTGKLPCRLSARARGRRSLPRAVCSGSVPRGAGTTSNRAEPGRCLQEGTGMLTVPPGAGHPQRHCGHLPGPPGWPAAHGTTLLLMLVPRGVGMGTECCACPTVPPFPVPRGAPCTALSCQHNHWSMYFMSAHGKAEVGWLQAGHTGTLSSSSQSQLSSSSWLCRLPPLWVLLPEGCQEGCSPWAPRLCSTGAPAGWGSQVPGLSASPCCLVRCQGCYHHWVIPVSERGETVELDSGTWDCCPLPVPVGCRTERDLDTPPGGARAWPELLLLTAS